MKFFLCISLCMVSIGCDLISDVLGLNTQLDAQLITSDSTSFYINGKYRFVAQYKNPEKEDATVYWSTDRGTFFGDITTGDTVTWCAPDTVTDLALHFTVKSDKGESAMHRTIRVSNRAPKIMGLTLSANAVVQQNKVRCVPVVTDPDNEELIYTWDIPAGSYQTYGTDSIVWTSPETIGTYTLKLTVSDKNGLSATASTEVVVYRVQGSFLVVNAGENNIKQFSEDGFHVNTFSGFTIPKKVIINQDELHFWVMDDAANKVSVFASNGTEIGSNSEFTNLKDITLDPRTGGVWVADDSVVVLLNRTAKTKLRTISGFDIPQRVVTGSNNDIFVIDEGVEPRIYIINTNTPSSAYHLKRDSTHHTSTSGYGRVIDIAYNRLSEHLWILDQDRREVIRMKKDSTDVFKITYNFTNPYFMAQQNDYDLTWVNDDHRLAVFTGVNGAIIQTQEDFKEIGGIGIITYSGEREAWISDAFNHRVVRLNASGTVKTTVTGVSVPKSIAVYNGN